MYKRQGLTNMLGPDEIRDIVLSDVSLEEKAKTLIRFANNAGGLDNITVVLLHFNEAVSYTHLDVYKRQTLQALEEIESGNVVVHPDPEAKREALRRRSEAERIRKEEEERKIKEQIAKEKEDGEKI